MSFSEFSWVGAAVSLVAASLFVWVNWGRTAIRKRRMRRPYYAFFVVPPDESEKDIVTDLHVPPDSMVSVQLRLRPLLHYQHHEVIFGFIGDADQKPLPLRTLNEYIKTGKRREQSPETNEDHAIDRHDNYHIREKRELTKPNTYPYGFIVQTREPGCYPVRLEIITDSGEGFPQKGLFLTVEPREK